MKSVLFLALFFSSAAFAVPNAQECKVRETVAQQAYDLTNERFRVGELTIVDVNEAYLKLKKTQFKCRSIVRGGPNEPNSYCAQATIKAMSEYVAGVKEESAVGHRDADDINEALLKEAHFKSICGI